MNKYQYAPLDKDNEEIRLLHLLPGSRGSSCRCTLSHHSLKNDNVKYTALSYTWGSQDNPQSIIIEDPANECWSISVTRNLFIALDHIRAENETRTLWIDAICIDQNNIPERSYQVQRMREIYGGAAEVLVWLGPAQDNSDRALFDINVISWLMILADLTGTRESVYVDTTDYDMLALIALLRRPYFRRVWILQEIWAAKGTCLVRCGDSKLQIEHLRNFHHWCVGMLFTDHPNGVSEYADELLQAMKAIINISLISTGNKPISLFECLSISTYTKASDPRDYVFAMLGMIRQYERARHLIDYSKNVSQVFSAAAIFSFEAEGNLQFLEDKESFRNNPDLSSWTVDWGFENGEFNGRNYFSSELFRASKEAPLQFKAVADQQHLALRGILIAQVRSIEVATVEDFKLSDSSEERFVREESSKLYGTNGLDALWRTVVADTEISVISAVEKKRWSKNDDWTDIKQRCNEKFSSMVQIMTHPLSYLEQRKLLISSLGHFALAATEVEVGDLMVIFAGGNIPFLIRPTDENGHYKYICTAYVHGIMDGEAWDETDLQDFTLV